MDALKKIFDHPVTAIPTVIAIALGTLVGLALTLYVVYQTVVWMGT